MNTKSEYLHPNQITTKFRMLRKSITDSNFLHWLQLSICIIFSATWFIYSETIVPSLFDEALPALIIIILCMFVRSLNKK